MSLSLDQSVAFCGMSSRMTRIDEGGDSLGFASSARFVVGIAAYGHLHSMRGNLLSQKNESSGRLERMTDDLTEQCVRSFAARVAFRIPGLLLGYAR